MNVSLWTLLTAGAIVALGMPLSVHDSTASSRETLAFRVPGLVRAACQEAASIYVVAEYDPSRDPSKDLSRAIERAEAEGKRIIIEVGGQWCSWCHILDAFVRENKVVARKLRDSFVVLKVNFSSENRNREFLSRYPRAQGYPHIYVLESDGSFLHSQPTVALELGRSYSEVAVISFLDKWAPRKE
ncbi:MAG: DUF255 domain-containing protein [Gemmatimonadales bacterium]|nr:DUF255 domain-containing protein [Gemmatimonadales bacterium]